MPTRGRVNKATKPATRPGARRGSRQASLSNAAQQQLEQLAQQANSNVAHDVPHGDDMLANDGAMASSMASSLDSSLDSLGSNDDFQLDHQMPDQSSPDETEAAATATTTRTAADVAFEAYGDLVKIDSALCKKLAGEAALREPTQRRHDQKLNIERRSNVEALLAHVTGAPAGRPCKNCHKGHGPWTQCIVYDGQMCGSCTNCWFNASGSRCTFHENNHPQSQALYAAPVVVAPPPPAVLTYQPTSLPQPPTVNVVLSPPDFSHWALSDPTKQLITQAMGDVVTYSRRDRFLARIEAAARELGMRIAEYEEYLRTAEGAAEQSAALERTTDQGQDQDQTQAPEASVTPSHDGVLS